MKLVYGIVCLMLLGCEVGSGADSETTGKAPYSLDEVLKRLNQSTKTLTSYQSQIEYLFLQPDMFDARTLRKGSIFYKQMSDRSYLRINFHTKKEDDFDEQAYVEHYIFDGEWLTYINFVDKTIQKRQLAEPNHPVDAFELAQANMPMIGFSDAQDLRKEFEITLLKSEQEQAGLLHLRLTVKPESAFKDDYRKVDFWVSDTIWLPVKIEALTLENEIYRIRFLDPKINKTVSNSRFKFEAPAGFKPPEIYPLKSVEDNAPKQP